MAKSKSTKDLSPAHKAAMAAGRSESRIVKAYLEALESNRPKRGRKRTPQSIEARLAKIDAEMSSSDPLKRLKLTQEQMDLTAEMQAMSTVTDMADLEKQFVETAQAYSERRGISYEAWRKLGVPADTLKKAGVSR